MIKVESKKESLPVGSASKPLPKLEVLAQRVSKITEEFFVLKAENDALQANPAAVSEEQEDALLEKVIDLSREESEVNQDLISLRQASKQDENGIQILMRNKHMTRDAAAKCLGITTPSSEKVQEQLQLLREPISPVQTQPSTPRSPSTSPQRISRPAQQATQEQLVVAAEHALAEFEYFLSTQVTDDETKDRLATDMHYAFLTVKNCCTQTEFRKSERFLELERRHDNSMMFAYSPKFPSARLTELEEGLKNLIRQAWKSYPKQQNALDDYVQSLAREKYFLEERAKLFKPYNTALAQLGINTSTYKFKHEILGQIDTPISYIVNHYSSQCIVGQHDRLTALVDTQYQEHEAGGGGDCLFHSLAHQLSQEGRVITSSELRKNIVEEMDQNRLLYSPLILDRIRTDPLIRSAIQVIPNDDNGNVARYLAYMRREQTKDYQGSWGGNPELQAFSTIYRRAILIRQQGSENRIPVNNVVAILPRNGAAPRITKPILVKNLFSGHFRSLTVSKKHSPIQIGL